MSRCENCTHGTLVDGLYYRCALQVRWRYQTRCNVGRWRQRGFGVIEIVLILLVLSIGAGLVYTYKNAIVRAERAERDLSTLQTAHQEQLAENTNLRQRQAHTDRLLAEREARRNTAAEIERKVDEKLSQIYRSDPAAREWRDVLVPGAVLRGLRGPAAGDGAHVQPGAPPGGADGRHARP